MTQQNPFPAIDPNDLGEFKTVSIDRLLIPYLIGAAEQLTDPSNYYGDPEDVQGTVLAMQLLLADLSDPS